MRFIGLGFATLLLMVVLVRLLYRSRISDEERIEQNARVAAKNLFLIQSGQKWGSPSFLLDRALGRATDSRYIDLRRNSESNLVSRGYFAKRTFHFEHGTHSWKEFSEAIKRKFTEGDYCTCAYLTSESSIEVITRPNRVADVEQLVLEYDKADP